MPKPRSAQIAIESTPYYHCVSRCVRRAFLCGKDSVTGQDYEHRRGWIEKRLLKLGHLFCIDICAYAVVSNHFHVVLHINTKLQLSLTLNQTIERWHFLLKGNTLSQQFIRGETLCDAELDALNQIADEARNRLADISWFMRALNEKIARDANFEDHCTGRFWEPDADQAIQISSLIR